MVWHHVSVECGTHNLGYPKREGNCCGMFSEISVRESSLAMRFSAVVTGNPSELALRSLTT